VNTNDIMKEMKEIKTKKKSLFIQIHLTSTTIITITTKITK